MQLSHAETAVAESSHQHPLEGHAAHTALPPAQHSTPVLAPQPLRDDFVLWSYTAPMGYGLDAPMLLLPDELFGFTLADLIDQFVAQRIVPVSAADKAMLLAEGKRLVRFVNRRRRKEYRESNRCHAQTRFMFPYLAVTAAAELGPYLGVPYPLIWLQVCQDGFRVTPGHKDNECDLIDAIYHVHHDGLLSKFRGWEVEQYRRYKLNPLRVPSLIGFIRDPVDNPVEHCRLPLGSCSVHATPSSDASSLPTYLEAAALLLRNDDTEGEGQAEAQGEARNSTGNAQDNDARDTVSLSGRTESVQADNAEDVRAADGQRRAGVRVQQPS